MTPMPGAQYEVYAPNGLVDSSAIEPAEILHLTPRDQQTFADALLMPPAQSPALKRAFESANKLIQRESI